ncbi:hypothetical protein RB195_007921 [Necator americanus]|uniref:Uncharacterized protein n=1 Tax=Necator americanus TaxID=51031 RepID=A0ABR1BZJ9_NECAM
MTCGGQPAIKSVLLSSQTSLVPIYRHRRDERLGVRILYLKSVPPQIRGAMPLRCMFLLVVPYTSLSLLPIHYLSLLLSCLHEEGPHCYAGTQPRYTRNICTS